MTWFEEWFDENYLELYAERDPEDAMRQANLIEGELGGVTSPWLDVGCGNGRYTEIFQERGHPITGIDISKTLVDLGKKNNPSLNIRHAGVEEILRESVRYGVVLSLFTSFGYYEGDEDNQEFLKKLGDLTVGGGFLWLDFLNAKKLLNDPLGDTLFQGKSKMTYHQRRRILYPQRRIEKTIDLHDQGGNFVKSYRESVRLYTREDLTEMLARSGFAVKKVFGDYQGGEYHPYSPRLILLSEKLEKSEKSV